MFLTKLKSITPELGLAVVVLLAGGLLASGGNSKPNTPKAPAAQAAAPKPAAQPAPKPAGPGRLLVWNETRFVFYTPDGKEGDSLPAHPDKRIIHRPAVSPDGKWVAFLGQEDPAVSDLGFTRHHVFVRAADGTGEGKKIPVNATTLFWSADGKRLVATEVFPAKEIKDLACVTWSIDPQTGEKTDLNLPKLTIVEAATPDGKAFVGQVLDLAQMKIHLAGLTADGQTVTKLAELRNEAPHARVSPDGTKVLYRDYDPDDKPGKDEHHLMRLYVFDLKAMKKERLAEVPNNALVIGYCWAPDGKKVAYTWKQAKPGVPLAGNTDNMNDPKINTETESFLVIADADGKNPKTVLSRKAQFAPTTMLGDIDWR
jgi:Tol biopolymer transport system component